jgi:hypothetical protein
MLDEPPLIVNIPPLLGGIYSCPINVQSEFVWRVAGGFVARIPDELDLFAIDE